MDKDPTFRYRSAGEMLSDLRLLQDALRFGKSLTWPIRGEGKRPPTPVEPQPVAPRMSAVRTEEEAEALPRKARKERDVPVWMLVLMTALAAALLSLVGIWVMFNMNRPKLVTVPNVKGLSVEEARAVLQESKMDLRVSQKVPNEQVAADRIIETSPEPNRKVREGGQVMAVVSLGSKFVEMPDVRGMTLDKAKSVLEGLDLDVELPVQNVPSRVVPIGSVARQSPAPRQKIERLGRVRLYVSSGASSGGSRNRDEEPPSEVLYQYTVRVAMPDIPEPVNVRVDIIDPESPNGRTIYQRQHGANEAIEAQAQSSAARATFVIYYDDVEVSRVEEQAEGARRE
jgi:serine/threonine-protein kinase